MIDFIRYAESIFVSSRYLPTIQVRRHILCTAHILYQVKRSIIDSTTYAHITAANDGHIAPSVRYILVDRHHQHNLVNSEAPRGANLVLQQYNDERGKWSESESSWLI